MIGFIQRVKILWVDRYNPEKVRIFDFLSFLKRNYRSLLIFQSNQLVTQKTLRPWKRSKGT